LILQYLSQEYKKLTTKDEQKTKKRNDKRKKREEENKIRLQKRSENLSSKNPADIESNLIINDLPLNQDDDVMRDDEFKESKQGHREEIIDENIKAKNKKIYQQLMALPEPKFDKPLPPLPPEKTPSKNGEMHHIQKDELLAHSMDNSSNLSLSYRGGEANLGAEGIFLLKPEDENNTQSQIKTKDNQSEEIQMGRSENNNEDGNENGNDNDNDESEGNENIKMKSLEIIQENNSELSNSNSLISGRSVKHTKRNRNHMHKDPSNALSSQVSDKDKRHISSFCSARAPREEGVFLAKDNKRLEKVKTSRNKSNEDILNSEAKNDTAVLKQKLDIEEEEKKAICVQASNDKKQEILETPILQREERVPFAFPNSSNFSVKAMKTIQTLTHGSQVTGEYSTNFTNDPSRLLHKFRNALALRKTKPDPQSIKIDPAFLAQMAEECRGTDNLNSLTAGVLFGAGLLSEYINLPSKGTMFQSFGKNRPGISMNDKHTPGASSSITIKKLSEDSAETSEITKVKKKSVIPIGQSPDTLRQLQSKLRLIMQDDLKCKKKSNQINKKDLF